VHFHPHNTPFADLAQTEVEFDLALFPNVSLLRFTPVDVVPPMVLATLSTGAPVHHIRKIMIDLGRDQSHSGYQDIDLGGKPDCEPLDSKLSTLPKRDPLSAEFEVHLGISEHESEGFLPWVDVARYGACFILYILCASDLMPSNYVSLSGAKRCLVPGGRYVPSLRAG
jgi:hypothetical protein